jgi:hypothetical protein
MIALTAALSCLLHSFILTLFVFEGHCALTPNFPDFSLPQEDDL